jgi:hypothetical protein
MATKSKKHEAASEAEDHVTDRSTAEQVEDPVNQRAKPPIRMLTNEQQTHIWRFVAQAGEVPDQFTHDPTVWQNVARQMQQDHEIIIVAAEGTWRLHLYVRAVGRNEAYVGVIGCTEFKNRVEAPTEESPYAAVFGGPGAKYRVVRKSDGDIVKENFQTMDAANAWIKSHLRALAA